MKKLFFSLIVISLISGCTLFQNNTSPIRAVETFLGKYQSLDEEVITQLDNVIANENFTEEQQDNYRELMKKQYQNLNYEIKEDVINGNDSTVTVEIEVYDYATPQNDIDDYVDNNREEFLDVEGMFSTERYTDYKIEQLQATTDRINYTLDLKLTKTNDKWALNDLNDIDIRKIQGVY